MDFGKKGDAKKAMKIHHREGISLKQAWKRVKGKDSKKKSKTSSPRKRKAQAAAKKAMKLKWREGITLKEAWKRVNKFGTPLQGMTEKAMNFKLKDGITVRDALKMVNKFGDTVCPSGFEPNTRWTGKVGQRQCLKACDFYEMRDPVTNRCKKTTMAKLPKTVPEGMEINPLTGRLRKICGPANIRNSKGRCIEPKAPLLVLPGMEINPKTGRLRKMCLPGEYRDPVTNRCKTIKPLLQPLEMPTLSFGKRKCGFGTCKACAAR